MILVVMEECSYVRNMSSFEYFRALWSRYSVFQVGPGACNTVYCKKV